mmetsp:Transcript_37631/g.108640  ORF Transcript_37631/g.108640 Transcript_37631/m.108640 type:complete len:492 (+) Transcript_37631:117-1592(+)
MSQAQRRKPLATRIPAAGAPAPATAHVAAQAHAAVWLGAMSRTARSSRRRYRIPLATSAWLRPTWSTLMSLPTCPPPCCLWPSRRTPRSSLRPSASAAASVRTAVAATPLPRQLLKLAFPRPLPPAPCRAWRRRMLARATPCRWKWMLSATASTPWRASHHAGAAARRPRTSRCSFRSSTTRPRGIGIRCGSTSSPTTAGASEKSTTMTRRAKAASSRTTCPETYNLGRASRIASTTSIPRCWSSGMFGIPSARRCRLPRRRCRRRRGPRRSPQPRRRRSRSADGARGLHASAARRRHQRPPQRHRRRQPRSRRAPPSCRPRHPCRPRYGTPLPPSQRPKLWPPWQLWHWDAPRCAPPFGTRRWPPGLRRARRSAAAAATTPPRPTRPLRQAWARCSRARRGRAGEAAWSHCRRPRLASRSAAAAVRPAHGRRRRPPARRRPWFRASLGQTAPPSQTKSPGCSRRGKSQRRPPCPRRRRTLSSAAGNFDRR